MPPSADGPVDDLAPGIPEPASSGSAPSAVASSSPDAAAADATGVTPSTVAGLLGAIGTGVPIADAGTTMTRKDRREVNSGARPTKIGKKAKPKRTWLDWLLLSGVVLVSVALVTVVSGYAYVQYRFNQVTKVTVRHLKVAPVGSPFNVLLIGSDSRSNFSGKDENAYGNSSTAGGQRSDVIKIAHVVPATGQVSILSIPRDTVVKVAGDTSQIGTYNRINATYNTGPDQLVQTIESNFGISIQHVVQLNFIGFRGAVDAIGGVNLNFPYPARDSATGLNIATAGCQHVNGGYSLAVARSRHYQYYANGYWQSDGTSDFGRIQRQNAFLKALITQAEKQYNPLTQRLHRLRHPRGDHRLDVHHLRTGLAVPALQGVRLEHLGHLDAPVLFVGFVRVLLIGFGPVCPAASGQPDHQPVPRRPGTGGGHAAAGPLRPCVDHYDHHATDQLRNRWEHVVHDGASSNHDNDPRQLRPHPLLNGSADHAPRISGW